MEGCVFCKIAAGNVPSTRVYEDEEFFAFRDINPSAPVHDVLIPKKHVISNLGEADKTHVEMLGRMLLCARKIAESEGIAENFRVRTNTGRLAGQSVWHIHFHIQGGWKEENKVIS